jgi:Ca2+-binding EF-hand superfamily protein
VTKLRATFDEIDVNGDKSLSQDELTSAMGLLGQQINPKALKAVIKACDKTGDGSIEFEEFVAIVAARIKVSHSQISFSPINFEFSTRQRKII